MYHTKRIDETYPLEGKGLENCVLRKVSSLHTEKKEIGKVLQVGWNANYPGCFDNILQGELYFKALPSDVFFEKGLIRREHTFEPLRLEKPLEGIVISKGPTGIYLNNAKNALLIRPEHIEEITDILAYHEKQKETFAGYTSSGNSFIGFQGYYYQPPGPNLERDKVKFIEKKDVGTIKKKTKTSDGKNNPIAYEYWNDKKVSETWLLCNGSLEVTIERYELKLCKTLKKSQDQTTKTDKREGINLERTHIPALKKIIEIYTGERKPQYAIRRALPGAEALKQMKNFCEDPKRQKRFIEAIQGNNTEETK